MKPYCGRDTDQGEDGPLELNDTGFNQSKFYWTTSIPYNSTQTPPGGHDWFVQYQVVQVFYL